MKDGWHRILHDEVFVKDNRILYGCKMNGEGEEIQTIPYRFDRKKKVYEPVGPVNVSTFRHGDYLMLTINTE